jgi:hypothetical protein
VKLNQVNVPFVQSPAQVTQISRLPEKELIRSPIKMIAQTPVIGPMNGVVRSPVQHQPHPIHVWQQETTAKFIQPINQANNVVTQQNFPIRPQQITIPQASNTDYSPTLTTKCHNKQLATKYLKQRSKPANFSLKFTLTLKTPTHHSTANK